MEKRIRVAMIDDHYIMLNSVTNEAARSSDIEMVGTATDGNQLVQLVHEKHPDVVILDLKTPKGNFKPLPVVRKVIKEYPETHILVLTGLDDDLLMRYLLTAGVRGYILKGDEASQNILDAVRKIHHGEMVLSNSVTQTYIHAGGAPTPLTDQEIEILIYLAKGLENEAIGKKMDLSERRIRNALTVIYKKLEIEEGKGINRRVAAINKARALGLIPDEGI